MEIVTVFVFLFGWCYGDPLSTPAYMIVGKGGKAAGEIWRCPLETPTICELFYRGDSPVTDTLVHGERLYASHDNGVVLICNWYEKPHCEKFYRAGTFVNSLAASDGFLYVGVADGNIIRCKFNLARSCSTVYTFSETVRGLFKHDKYMNAVTPGYLAKCSRGTEVLCQLEKSNTNPRAVSAWGNTIINLSMWGYVGIHIMKSNRSVEINGSGYYDMAVFQGTMYAVRGSERQVILTCRWDKDKNCTLFAEHEDTRSISFVYRTHVQNWPSQQHEACGRSGHSTVFQYAEENRALLEVGVVDGHLWDADTRRADAGRSGRAGVFAMGPDGQLLLSAAHGSGLVDVTSLFAGAPVAGAGEMHVEDGVIKRIVACAERYRADVELNRQVVAELYSRGYTREIPLEECAYTCDRD